MQDTGIEQLTIAFRDSEAFETAVLADLLLILRYALDAMLLLFLANYLFYSDKRPPRVG
jgi:uncharacterized membrane protein